MSTSIVTTKGQIVIPSKIRRQFGIKAGTKVHFVIEPSEKHQEEKIVLEPVTPEFYRKLRGSLKGTGVLQSLIEERAKDKERENQ